VIRDSAHYHKGIDEFEVARRPLAQPDIAERFFAIDGNVHHVDPIITRFGPRRPAPGFAGYRTPVPRLFLTGSGNPPDRRHQRLPGKNAADTVIKYFRSEDREGKVAHTLREARSRAATET
jgi:phytoene dehydrogenase-like protein